MSTSARKANGPEALERLPSHVITNPAKDQEMNADSFTTEAATAEAATIFHLIDVAEEICCRYVEAADNDGEPTDALCAEMAAVNDLIAAYPVAVIGEATAKARYLLAAYDAGADPLSFPVLLSVLQSLDQEAETPLERLSRAAFEYREAAQELEPDATDWTHVRPDDDESVIRFRLEGRLNLVPAQDEVTA